MKSFTDEPAYIVHSRSYSETSLLLDVFTLKHGKIALIAKGVKRPKSPLKGVLQPFSPLLLSVQQGRDLHNLTDASPAGTLFRLQGDALYCALYVNELLQYLLPPAEPMMTVFGAYSGCLSALMEGEPPGPILRQFEYVLLDALGVYPDLERDAESGEAISAERVYVWWAGHGFIEMGQWRKIASEVMYHPPLAEGSRPSTLSESMLAFNGSDILTMAAGKWEEPLIQACAKRFMRILIDGALNGRSLKSRQLIQAARRLM